MSLPWLLTGFPGCGKTTVGPRLASLSDRLFVDLDGLVAARNGLPVPRLIAEAGESHFRELEREALAALLAPRDSRVAAEAGPLVVALGGGTLEHEPSRTLVSLGILAWLAVPLETCLRRLEQGGANDTSRRPLLEATLAAGGLDAVKALHGQRCLRHALAAVRVAGEASPAAVARELHSLLLEAEAKDPRSRKEGSPSP